MNLPPPRGAGRAPLGIPASPTHGPAICTCFRSPAPICPWAAASASRRSVATSIVSYIFGGIGYTVIIAMTATSYQPSSSRWYFRPSWR
jgi:hypothetical protein